ncbi:photosynthetic complex assembly protein PuhC [Sphingomonas sp.]|jgi:putative photosynthetic complex assembly protein|uniref:photosynthetic complex assembly protein PuhC n=1 Tax=Sphingomonas sp. TaxID=28214 RepID=UPI002D7F0025|nr:photosynthetic complex assembly protein PuhC [Sphingomonas sp.]HEU0045647.1 photosynthetic complex assembly protein PuhC [Sphingomonas sp.]
MSTASARPDTLPRGTLILAAAMITFAVGAATVSRVAGIPAAASPAALRATTQVTALASRSLRFVDRADGAVVIHDVGKGTIAAVIEPGEETGFIRGVMRGLARERRMHGVGDRPPFTLTAWRDGELTLTDSATGRSIEMTAFGSSNRAAFAALLPIVSKATRS